jgi:hypothetical protein
MPPARSHIALDICILSRPTTTSTTTATTTTTTTTTTTNNNNNNNSWFSCVEHTTRFHIKKLYVVPTLPLCVLYGSQNKQQLLPYETLRDRFL